MQAVVIEIYPKDIAERRQVNYTDLIVGYPNMKIPGKSGSNPDGSSTTELSSNGRALGLIALASLVHMTGEYP
jgi:hypothetical protein